MTSDPGNEALLFNRCLDLSKQLGESSASFVISIKLGRNSFFVTSKKGAQKYSENVTKGKKYISPFTRRRNNLRLLAFKARRSAKGGCSPNQPVAPPPLNSDRPSEGGSDGTESHVTSVDPPVTPLFD